MHEGIDTESVSPDPAAVFEWNGLSLTAGCLSRCDVLSALYGGIQNRIEITREAV